jgi:acyl-CoA thioester hydrolase
MLRTLLLEKTPRLDGHIFQLFSKNLPAVVRHVRGYNQIMSAETESHAYHFYHPIEVRYADLDPQGHVNNVCYFSYIEQARVCYVKHLGFWSGGSFLNFGFILADAKLSFKAPIQFGQALHVGVRVTRLGNKSMTMIYRLEDPGNDREFASGSTVLVAYDYHRDQSVPIPDDWRETISAYENIPKHSRTST